MSEPFIKEAKKSSLLIKLVLGAVVVAAVAALGVMVFKFISYKETGGIPTEPSNAQVAISYPQQGTQLELSDSMKVEAAAIGSTPFTSMELWINGELMGVQAAPSGGAHPFSTFFSWIPVEEGTYSLIAAAIDTDGNKEISAQTVVFVAQTESGNEQVSSDLYGSPSVMPPPSGGGYPPPDKPSDKESIGPASNWKGSTGDWVTSLMADVKPTAPELFATAGECGALLQFHDLSDNEEGFAIYRQVGISPMWVKIATLSSQSDLDWITYTDEGIYGAVYYYVSAFNSQGESKSNFVMVSIDPTDCVSDSEEVAVGTLEMTLQIPNPKAEKVYCYLSTNGIDWERWPLLGFLTPDVGENQIAGPIMAYYMGGEDQSEAGSATQPNLNLFMECWGWEGGNLQKLGELVTEGLNPQADKSFTIPGEGFKVEMILETSIMADQAAIFPIGPLIIGGVESLMNPDQLDWQDVTSAVLPRPFLEVGYDPNWCGYYLPPDAQNIFGKLIYCFPYPAYDPDKGGTGPQPYLGWEFGCPHCWPYSFDYSCPAGHDEDCVSYSNLLSIAEETGGQVGFTITALQNGKKTVWNVTEPDLKMFVVPPMTCPGNVMYSVRLWYRPGKKSVAVAASPENKISEIGEMGFSPAKVFYSEESYWSTFPCANEPDPNWTFDNQAQYLDITFSDLSFYGIDDGQNDIDFGVTVAESLELYGYFRVKAPSMGHLEDENCFFPEFGGCDGGQPWSSSQLVGTYRYLLVDEWETEGAFEVREVQSQFGGGPYTNPPIIDLLDVPLCQSTTKYSCSVEGQGTSFEIDNNTIRVFVTHLDALKLQVKLVDYDEASDDDVVCTGTKLIPSKTLNDWTNIDGGYYVIHGETTDSGSCNVYISVKAVGDPVQVDTHWSD